jgi:hypothetical protein
MDKVYSYNEEDWEDDWGVFLDDFKDELGIENDQDLIGEEYFEGDQALEDTGKLVNIKEIVFIIGETAVEEMGEWGEDYPRLTEKDEAELKGMIAAFLDKKDGRQIRHVENIVKKTITAEDFITYNS